eukprot:2899363-Rhodomonas_salina.1
MPAPINQAKEQKIWFETATRALVDHARGKDGKQDTKQSIREAKLRSSELSTSSDKKGVSFAGSAFQAEYFTSKFARRGMLLYAVMSDLSRSSGPQGLFPVRSDSVVQVASFGGGPGTDAAGIVWIQKELFPSDSVQCVLYDYEKSWKRYLKTLSDLFAPAVYLDFQPCDVTQTLDAEVNRKVEIAEVDLLLFFYVCHETSQRNKMSFYRDVATRAKEGALVVIADVHSHSRSHLAEVVRCMAEKRKILPLPLKKPQNTAEVLAFRLM